MRDNLPVQMKANDAIDIEILESDFNGHILMAKNHKSNLAKFVDLDLLEEMNQISVGEGKYNWLFSFLKIFVLAFKFSMFFYFNFILNLLLYYKFKLKW